MLRKRFANFSILFQQSAEKGMLLLFACLLALYMANSNFKYFYHHIIHNPFIQIFDHNITFEKLVNDGLMVLFFLLVGLEIKRELFEGKLSTKSQRILPVFAALGGVIAPVGIYCLFNYHDAAALKGWAVPAATDIAFALGMFALLGKGLPVSLRIFLTALAIVDDLIAVILIAIFYSDDISIQFIMLALTTSFILYLLCRARYSKALIYLILGVSLWYFTIRSGIHPTISGVVLGLLIPISDKSKKFSLIKYLENLLHPYVLFIILPLFAFVNSGVTIVNLSLETFTNTITLGIIIGLFVGKQIGICSSWLILKKLDLYNDKNSFTISQFYSVSLLCGIGFTMSLFVGNLAFSHNKELLDAMKIGVLSGSLLSTVASSIVIKLIGHKT